MHAAGPSSANISCHWTWQGSRAYAQVHNVQYEQENQSWVASHLCSWSIGAPEAEVVSSMMPLRSTLYLHASATTRRRPQSLSRRSCRILLQVSFCWNDTERRQSCARRCVDRVQAVEPRWGVLYFAYDWFSAIRTDMVREVMCVFPLLLTYALACTLFAYIRNARIFVRASTTGSAPFGRTWCGRSCARPHPSHQTLCISLQHPHVSVRELYMSWSAHKLRAFMRED